MKERMIKQTWENVKILGIWEKSKQYIFREFFCNFSLSMKLCQNEKTF